MSVRDKCLEPVRLAEKDDLKGVIELWANSACLKQISDFTRWKWQNKASQLWFEYAKELLNNSNYFLIICDFGDNGVSGFLSARIEKLPNYNYSSYSLSIEEFYIRPKERSPELFQDMILCLLKQAKERFSISLEEKINLKIETLEQDRELINILFEKKPKKSSIVYSFEL